MTDRRTRRGLLRALGIALLPLPAPAQEALPMLPFGQEAKWQAIGRVNAAGFRTTRMCTGTLIAPELVLTAAHCLFKPDGRQIATDKLRFVAGLDRGEYAGIGRVRSVALHPGAFRAGQIDPRRDLALLALTEALEGVAPLPLGVGTPSTVALVGYHRGRPQRLSAGFACAAHRTAGLVLVGCPVRPGNSGGPMLARGAAGWRVIGVVSATDGARALGAPVDDWLRARAGD